MSQITTVRQAIAHVVDGSHLSRAEAKLVMLEIMEGSATPAQIASLATALRMKGETTEEITGFAVTMRSKSDKVYTLNEGLLDTCGTGGDGANTFNISTASAIVAAAGGVRVAKHGNRAMSSQSGSADVLEALGVNIGLNSEQVAICLEKAGICFMFAQLFHGSMKHAAGPRKEIGIRTVFNLLGPLTNPAHADRQVLGVFDRNKTELMASVLKELGLKRALVVASMDGLDEISVAAPTQVTELRDGQIRTSVISPEELGLTASTLAEIKGGTPQENAAIIKGIMNGQPGAGRDIVMANAAACLYISDLCGSISEGVQLAGKLIDSGKAAEKLRQLIKHTGELYHVS